MSAHSSMATALAPGGVRVARRAIAYLSAPRQEDRTLTSLTPRERGVLELIADGLANAAIAQRLGISPNTIANYTSTIFGKLHVASRAEAIAHARNAGLGSLRPQNRAY